jgi:hypothetical protein
MFTFLGNLEDGTHGHLQNPDKLRSLAFAFSKVPSLKSYKTIAEHAPAQKQTLS